MLNEQGMRGAVADLFHLVIGRTGSPAGDGEEMIFRLWRSLARHLAFHGRARAELIGHLVNDNMLSFDPDGDK